MTLKTIKGGDGSGLIEKKWQLNAMHDWIPDGKKLLGQSVESEIGILH